MLLDSPCEDDSLVNIFVFACVHTVRLFAKNILSLMYMYVCTLIFKYTVEVVVCMHTLVGVRVL